MYEFDKIAAWICLSCYIDLSMLFYVFLALCQTKPSWRFQSLLKLLLWTKGVEWVKVHNVLGPLCPWQCLYLCLYLKTVQRAQIDDRTARQCGAVVEQHCWLIILFNCTLHTSTFLFCRYHFQMYSSQSYNSFSLHSNLFNFKMSAPFAVQLYYSANKVHNIFSELCHM